MIRQTGLNAPSGAQCFPTKGCKHLPIVIHADGLNAPSGAQYCPTGALAPFVIDGEDALSQPHPSVSMHLLVLNAFRPEDLRQA